jgi:RND family efflux transporter MFP subunit
MKLSNSARSLLAVLVVFLVVGGTIAHRLLREDDARPASQTRELPDTAGVEVASVAELSLREPVAVGGAVVVMDTLWQMAVATGRAEAARRARVSTLSAGNVLSIRAREGQYVRAGQLVAQLDTVETTMRLEERTAALRQAENDHRIGMMHPAGALDPAQVAERERNLRVPVLQAEQALERARIEHERTRVRAPFAGRVADIALVEGQYAGPGTEVLTIVQVDPIRVVVEAGERDVPYMRPGRRARVQFTGLEGEVFAAVVEAVNPRVDEDRRARVTLTLPNPGERIRPGMYARAEIEARPHPERTLVPRAALTQRDRRDVVFVLRNANAEGVGAAEWRYVTPGLRNDRLVEIVEHEETSMVFPGEIVLIDGHQYLAHDWPVRLARGGERAQRPGR